MNIRLLVASTITLLTLTGAAFAEVRNGNWDKCPGGFDPSTSQCLSRDSTDGSSKSNLFQNYNGQHSTPTGLPDDQGGESNPQ
jgi:hypothetical protein